ncbi:MAG TPA: 7-carboxy-7-deazaguanine synthase QueE [Chthoniobacterales bacterium]
MLVSEIFYSIQGEGELTGIPSVFVRTSGCNLRCSWCDTKYSSWTPEGVEMGIDEILAKVDGFGSRHVVVTGGEPMIAKGIHQLAARLKEQGNHITIETAATVLPDGISCDLASLSPKLSNSTPDSALVGDWRDRHEKRRLQPEVIRDWIRNYNYQLKFVVAAEQDLGEIQNLVTNLGNDISPAKILLMPEGTDAATIRQRSLPVIEICKRYGYRYCDRLQIGLFGNTKGT